MEEEDNVYDLVEEDQYVKLVEGRRSEALTEMRRAVEMEDKTETASVTPGPLKPAREILGELLLQLNRPSEALMEFQSSLKKEPNRFWSLYGAAKAAKLTGDGKQASLYFKRLLTIAQRSDQPGRPELAEARVFIRHN